MRCYLFTYGLFERRQSVCAVGVVVLDDADFRDGEPSMWS